MLAHEPPHKNLHHCFECKRSFVRATDLERHQRRNHGLGETRFICPECENVFPRMDTLRRHREEEHELGKIDTQSVRDE
jgi:uncharacterized Zn-finger protein